MWLARDGRQRPVALKTAHDEDQQAWLRHEADNLARVDHRYVVRLVEAHPEGRWLALEYVEGPDLAHWARHQPLGVLVELFARLSEALAHLHERGLAHGDLKPANVLVDSLGCPRLIDLGSAREVNDSSRLEGFHGTLGYAAPEVLEGHPAGPASDLYSLGTLLYRLLTGHAPFESADPAALTWLPLSTSPPPPSSTVPNLPQALDELVLQLMSRDPARRPRRTASLASLLRASLRSIPAPPMVGMTRERELLRRSIASLLDGKSGVVVLHGPEGSGRSSLIREALATARREGAAAIERDQDPQELLDRLRCLPRPAVVACDEAGPATRELAARVIGERLTALILIRSKRPLMAFTNLGARHIRPSPLAAEHIRLILEANGQDPGRAEEIAERTRGLPAAVHGYVRPPAEGVPGLSREQRSLLEATASGPVPLAELARLLGMGEHELIDQAEPLLDQGLLEEVDDGSALRARRRS